MSALGDSPLARARAAGRAAAERKQKHDRLVLPFDAAGVVGVRYAPALKWQDWSDLGATAEDDQILTSHLDLLIACGEALVIRDEDAAARRDTSPEVWTTLEHAGQPLRLADLAAVEALGVNPAEIQEHVPHVKPGSARHNVLAIFATYATALIIGVDPTLHALRVNRWLNDSSAEADPIVPPASPPSSPS